MGNRLVVQFARGGRPREMMPYHQERTAPRTRRTVYRMSITGLPPETSWQVSIPALVLFHRARRLMRPRPDSGPGHLHVLR